MKTRRKVVTISLPADMANEYFLLAKREAKNKSELFREMFKTYKMLYAEKELKELQDYGTKQAKKHGILTEKDVELLVFEDR